MGTVASIRRNLRSCLGLMNKRKPREAITRPLSKSRGITTQRELSEESREQIKQIDHSMIGLEASIENDCHNITRREVVFL